jgi:hypothetical protein
VGIDRWRPDKVGDHGIGREKKLHIPGVGFGRAAVWRGGRFGRFGIVTLRRSIDLSWITASGQGDLRMRVSSRESLYLIVIVTEREDRRVVAE